MARCMQGSLSDPRAPACFDVTRGAWASRRPGKLIQMPAVEPPPRGSRSAWSSSAGAHGQSRGCKIQQTAPSPADQPPELAGAPGWPRRPGARGAAQRARPRRARAAGWPRPPPGARPGARAPRAARAGARRAHARRARRPAGRPRRRARAGSAAARPRRATAPAGAAPCRPCARRACRGAAPGVSQARACGHEHAASHSDGMWGARLCFDTHVDMALAAAGEPVRTRQRQASSHGAGRSRGLAVCSAAWDHVAGAAEVARLPSWPCILRRFACSIAARICANCHVIACSPGCLQAGFRSAAGRQDRRRHELVVHAAPREPAAHDRRQRGGGRMRRRQPRARDASTCQRLPAAAPARISCLT
jgi:hypothetical protein